MLKHVSTLILVLLMVFTSSSIYGLASDKEQRVILEHADSTHLNLKTGVSTYKGQVVLTQGTTILRGDKILTFTNKNNQLEKAIILGNPASYRTLIKPDNPEFIAVSNTINYYPQKGWIELIGNAKATQGEDSFAAPQINYDMTQGVIITPSSKAGRTQIIIQPKKNYQKLDRLQPNF